MGCGSPPHSIILRMKGFIGVPGSQKCKNPIGVTGQGSIPKYIKYIVLKNLLEGNPFQPVWRNHMEIVYRMGHPVIKRKGSYTYPPFRVFADIPSGSPEFYTSTRAKNQRLWALIQVVKPPHPEKHLRQLPNLQIFHVSEYEKKNETTYEMCTDQFEVGPHKLKLHFVGFITPVTHLQKDLTRPFCRGPINSIWWLVGGRSCSDLTFTCPASASASSASAGNSTPIQYLATNAPLGRREVFTQNPRRSASFMPIQGYFTPPKCHGFHQGNSRTY